MESIETPRDLVAIEDYYDEEKGSSDHTLSTRSRNAGFSFSEGVLTTDENPDRDETNAAETQAAK